jgi:hypothetical protein
VVIFIYPQIYRSLYPSAAYVGKYLENFEWGGGQNCPPPPSFHSISVMMVFVIIINREISGGAPCIIFTRGSSTS